MEEIVYIDRNSGDKLKELVPSHGMLNWLYGSTLGKATLFLLMKRKLFSSMGGLYMNSRLSCSYVDRFITEYNIDLSEYCEPEDGTFKHFNDFFYRKIKAGVRPLANDIVSPADGKLVAFESLADVRQFFIKGQAFSLQDFLKDELLASRYADGAMVIVRLAPTDYHRFHFPASGIPSVSKPIKGHYYSVSPLALRKSLRIFCENYREYCNLKTQDYGNILIVDIGATMVGSIIQTYEAGKPVQKGDEKGYFAFGGSTLVLLFEKGKVQFDADLLQNSKAGFETAVKMGEHIASGAS